MDKTTENIDTAVPPKIMEHYNDVYLDIDILFVNKTPFLLTISRNIGFIHCRPMSLNVTKKIQNAMKQITLDYQAKGFNVVTAFGDGEFDHRIRSELHIDLDICAADSLVPRAENATKFVKERLRSI